MWQGGESDLDYPASEMVRMESRGNGWWVVGSEEEKGGDRDDEEYVGWGRDRQFWDGEIDMSSLFVPGCSCFVSTLPPCQRLAPALGHSVLHTRPFCLGRDHGAVPEPWVTQYRGRHLLFLPYFPVWPGKSWNVLHLLPRSQFLSLSLPA